MVHTERPGHLVEQLFRHSAGQLVATLARALGPARIDLAEEAVQEAMLRALRRWPFAGVPDNPKGWLYQVARNTALDLVRHDEVMRAKLPLLVTGDHAEVPAGDDELAMTFLCCHPGLPLPSQVALTLKTVGGLGVDEIAAALLTRPAAVAQRLVRAKRWLREHADTIEVPGFTAPTRRFLLRQLGLCEVQPHPRDIPRLTHGLRRLTVKGPDSGRVVRNADARTFPCRSSRESCGTASVTSRPG